MSRQHLIPHPYAGDSNDDRYQEPQVSGIGLLAHPPAYLGARDGADNQSNRIRPDYLACHHLSDCAGDCSQQDNTEGAADHDSCRDIQEIYHRRYVNKSTGRAHHSAKAPDQQAHSYRKRLVIVKLVGRNVFPCSRLGINMTTAAITAIDANIASKKALFVCLENRDPPKFPAALAIPM